MKAMLEQEEHQRAKEVFQIILVYCGEIAFAENLVAIISKDGQPYVRKQALNAVWQAGYFGAIPELIECLLDSSESVRMDHASGSLIKDFPVRRSAAFALRKLGVSVEELEDSQYRPDKRSAVNVLKQKLDQSSDEMASSLMKAISKIGGHHARKALNDFIRENKDTIDKAKLVAEAKKLLSELDDSNDDPNKRNEGL